MKLCRHLGVCDADDSRSCKDHVPKLSIGGEISELYRCEFFGTDDKILTSLENSMRMDQTLKKFDDLEKQVIP